MSACDILLASCAQGFVYRCLRKLFCLEFKISQLLLWAWTWHASIEMDSRLRWTSWNAQVEDTYICVKLNTSTYQITRQRTHGLRAKTFSSENLQSGTAVWPRTLSSRRPSSPCRSTDGLYTNVFGKASGKHNGHVSEPDCLSNDRS